MVGNLDECVEVKKKKKNSLLYLFFGQKEDPGQKKNGQKKLIYSFLSRQEKLFIH